MNESSPLVMVTTRDNGEAVVIHYIDKAVCVINTARPETGEVLSQGFGLSNAFKWRALGVDNELVDPYQRFPVLRLPIEII